MNKQMDAWAGREHYASGQARLLYTIYAYFSSETSPASRMSNLNSS